MAASKSWDLFHIDLKTAFLQGQSYYVNRDVVCQLAPEPGHPPCIATRLKKPADGMNDAPRRWWNILDNCMIPTRADRCCCVLHSIQSRERARGHFGKGVVAQQNDTKSAFTKLRERSEMKATSEKKHWIPTAGSPATGKSVPGIIYLFVDDLFGTGGNEIQQRVLTRLRNISKLIQKMNDVTFTGQRIRWPQDHPERAVYSSQSKQGHR